MTTIAYREGVVAADSRETWEGEAAGTTVARCAKLFRKKVGRRDVVLATAGATYSGMLFVDWYGSGKEPPSALLDLDSEEDFDVLILDRGKVSLTNHLCRPIEVLDSFTAIGSGRKAALAAMHCGRSAREAVRIACLIDPYSAPPIVTMRAPGFERAPAKARAAKGTASR